MSDRATWGDTWAAIAQAIARRSLCTRAQVGAVIIDTQNRIVSTGYNGPPAGFSHGGRPCTEWCPRGAREPNPFTVLFPALFGPSTDYSDCPSLHAEANALMAADRSAWQGGTIFVTGDVCFNCAKLIANSGLKTVIIIDDGTDRTYRNPQKTMDYLIDCDVFVERLGE